MTHPIIHDHRLKQVVTEQPYPLLFATVSGAHLYGFPSPDSDVDLRGVHVLTVPAISRFVTLDETLEAPSVRDGLEIDLVSHDVRKFGAMLLKRNGYVLEQLFSPLIVQTTPEHTELQALAQGCITRHHAHHYLGFADNQWRLFEKEMPHRIKALLYVFRVLLTGIHLMQTGRMEANLIHLNDEYNLPYIPELVARKLAGAEKGTLNRSDNLEFYRGEVMRLRDMLAHLRDVTDLPDEPANRAALDDFLVRVRLDMGMAARV
jgi:uncharacterized protein